MSRYSRKTTHADRYDAIVIGAATAFELAKLGYLRERAASNRAGIGGAAGSDAYRRAGGGGHGKGGRGATRIPIGGVP